MQARPLPSVGVDHRPVCLPDARVLEYRLDPERLVGIALPLIDAQVNRLDERGVDSVSERLAGLECPVDRALGTARLPEALLCRAVGQRRPKLGTEARGYRALCPRLDLATLGILAVVRGNLPSERAG